MTSLTERLRQLADDMDSAAPGDCACDNGLLLEAAGRIEQLEKAAELAVKLFTPPYRGHCGIHLHETDKIMDERMDALSEALIATGYGWEEWT